MAFPNPIVECAFNNGSDETLYATQGWAEITPWVKTMSGPLRGRSNEVERNEAGTLTVVLDNTDSDFTPGNPSSPFYPNIKSNRRFRVRGKNMVAPNVARGGGADQSTVFFEKPTWSDTATYTTGVGDPVRVAHDPASYPALPAELTDHIEVTVAAGTYTGFRRLVSWVVPLEIGVRLTHSAHIWRVSGTEPGGMEGRFEIFYFDNEDVDIIASAAGNNWAGIGRPMERYFTSTPTTPTRKSFSHAPIGTAKYARVVWSVYYGTGTTISSPITYAITGIQTELPANLAPNPNGDWDALHWLGRGGSEITTPYTEWDDSATNWVGFRWADSVSLYQNIPHLMPYRTYAVACEVNLTAGHPMVQLTADEGATGPTEFRFPDTFDNFNDRTLGSGWGVTSGSVVSTGGITWTQSGTGTTDVTGGVGRMLLSTVNAPLYQGCGLSASGDWDLQIDFMLPVAPTGASVEIGPNVTFPNGAGGTVNDYGIQVNVNPGGTMDLQFRKYVNGTGTWGTPVTATQTFTTNTWYRVRMQRVSNRIRGSVVLADGRPPSWELAVVDITHAGVSGNPSVRSKLNTGNTNTLPFVVQVDEASFTKLNWVTLRTFFTAGGPDQAVELMIPDGQGSPANNEILVRGLNVQLVGDSSITVNAETPYPTGTTSWERPKDIFEGWVESWPWLVDSNEISVTVVDRLKRVGVIELANVVQETVLQDSPAMMIPFNDDPTNNNGTVTWLGSWAQDAEQDALAVTFSKGDLSTSTWTLGVAGPTDEPAMQLAPASTTVGYNFRIPYSADYSAPPPTGGTTKPPSTPPPTTTKKTYTKVYYATWSRSYDSDGTTRWDDSAHLYHGCYFCSNNQRALVGFNWSAIKSDLTGADIVSVYYTMKNLHARWNSGLYTNIGYHNYSSKPSTWSGSTVTESKWKVFFKETEKKSVSLGTSVGYGFKGATIKGIAVGPAPSNITDNYGYFAGATESSKPYLTITYKK